MSTTPATSAGFTMGDKTLATTLIGQIKNGFIARMSRYSPPAIVVWLVLAARGDKRRECHPSITTIQKDSGLARSSVYKGIDELVRAGEIDVVPGGGKGNPSNRYTILGGPQNELVQTANQFKPQTKVVQTTDKGSPPFGLKPDTVTKHSKPDTNSSCRKLRFDEADLETAAWMFGLIKTLDPGHKEPNLDQWANHIRLIREKDHRTDDEIRATFTWANADSFWQANILSPSKLREKFGQLSLRMKNGDHRGNGKHRFPCDPGQRHAGTTPAPGKF